MTGEEEPEEAVGSNTGELVVFPFPSAVRLPEGVRAQEGIGEPFLLCGSDFVVAPGGENAFTGVILPQGTEVQLLDASTGEVVVGDGELDGLRYGDLLTTRGIVGLRGAGFTYDGHYYVKSVNHRIKRGEYKQHFTITREGLGAIAPVVIP